MARGDVLPIIFFSILFGFFITKLSKKPRTQLSDFFHAAFETMMKLTIIMGGLLLFLCSFIFATDVLSMVVRKIWKKDGV